MFNKNFYPTPKSLAEKMFEKFGDKVLTFKEVLEPSAGKGDLISAFVEYTDKMYKERWGYNKDHKGGGLSFDTIELVKELRDILKGKEEPYQLRVVHDDFLTYNTHKRYDLILANPPFDEGAKHLHKMLDFHEKTGCAVSCLLNAETIKNAYSNERKHLVQRLEALGADIDFVKNAFLDAERTTSVEVAIVTLQKMVGVDDGESEFFERSLKKGKEQRDFEETDDSSLAENDLVKAIVKRYEIEVEAGVSFIREYKRIAKYFKNSLSEDDKYTSPTIKLTVGRGDGVNVNHFIEDTRMKYWSALFSNPKFLGKMTEKMRSKYSAKVKELANYEFSYYNIKTIQVEIIESLSKGVEENIIELFDELSHKYSWLSESSNNIHYYNGWKTNKAWIINKKVVLPLRAYDYFWKKFKYYDVNVREKITDIHKCLCYLDGHIEEDSSHISNILKLAEEAGESRNIKFKYFTLSFFKKGTCHIVFHDEELLKKFNIYGSMKKGWLPQTYGTATYEEMEAEEKAVVDSFEGKEAYDKVFKNKGYYLTRKQALLDVTV